MGIWFLAGVAVLRVAWPVFTGAMSPDMFTRSAIGGSGMAIPLAVFVDLMSTFLAIFTAFSLHAGRRRGLPLSVVTGMTVGGGLVVTAIQGQAEAWFIFPAALIITAMAVCPYTRSWCIAEGH
ncbi:hypothetical protein [Salininema proteolyticum]|uniref:Uncharacterized protein n=1 Tax=Salininema proteolyticum TaxID=1607685 RepID=A0ABV8U5G4_9ACTN